MPDGKWATPKLSPLTRSSCGGPGHASAPGRGQLVFGVEERSEAQGSPLPAGSVTARDMVEAAKSGYEYRLDERGTSWTLFKKTPQPVLFLDPRVRRVGRVGEIREVFRLKRGVTKSPSPRRSSPISVHVSERGRGQHRPGDALAPAGVCIT